MKHSTILRKRTFSFYILYDYMWMSSFLSLLNGRCFPRLPIFFLWIFSFFWFAIKTGILCTGFVCSLVLVSGFVCLCVFIGAPCVTICVHSTIKLCLALNWINNLYVCVCEWVGYSIRCRFLQEKTTHNKKQKRKKKEWKENVCIIGCVVSINFAYFVIILGQFPEWK